MTISNASADPDSGRRSRRALLAAALGGVGAWAASAIGRPSRVLASAGDNLILGEANDSGPAQTTLSTYALGASFTLKSTNDSAGATGIFGWAASSGPNRTRGVYGRSDSPAGIGVQGNQAAIAHGSGAAVQALGGQNHGLDASTAHVDAFAVQAVHSASGVAINGQGLVGVKGVANAAYGIGVQGQATTGSGTIGVRGDGRVTGVYGEATLGGGSGVIGIASATSASGGLSSGVYGSTESTTGMGVRAESLAGTGVNYGIRAMTSSPDGYAGHFTGRVFTTSFYELAEIADPAAPSANRARLFARDNGSSKTELCVRFPSGAVQVLATEP
jgi:hypothetical protein